LSERCSLLSQQAKDIKEANSEAIKGAKQNKGHARSLSKAIWIIFSIACFLGYRELRDQDLINEAFYFGAQ